MAGFNSTSVLVLCVDRDNDVGEVAGIHTPIVGEANLLKTAVEFAAKRPEDSDLNAIFAAIKLYRELKRSGGFGEVEVALVAGHREEGIKADIRIREELREILSSRKFESAILVSDGPTDELILPVLQGVLPVLSIHRVVVQQSRGVEESFLLMLRYARRLVEDEKYRKYSLGVPGLLIASYIFLSIIIPGFVWQILLLLSGLALLIKGFSLDVEVKKIYESSPLVFTSLAASTLLFILSVISGFNYIGSLKGITGIEAIGYFFLASLGGQVLVLDLIILSLLVPLSAQMLDYLFANKPMNPGDYGLIVFLVLFRQILLEYSKILVGGGSIFSLLYWIAVTIVVIALIVAFFTLISKRAVERRKT